MIKGLQKLGGVAALIAAMTLVVGIGMFATVMSGYINITPGESVAFLVDNQTTMFIWNFITLIVYSIFLVVLALALFDRLKTGAPALAQIATIFGLIWACLLIASGMVLNIGANTVTNLYGTDPAQAASAWIAIESVGNALGGEMEIVGSIWVLLVSLAALRSETLPKLLNYFGVLISVSAMITIIPGLELVALVFGLGLIVWFAWLGIVLLRGGPSVTA